MQSIKTLSKQTGARVLIRVDYNVPLVGNRIRDTRRIEASFKTIDAVLKKGGTPVLLAHLGDESASLRPVATFLSKKYKIVFIDKDIFDANFESVLNAVPAKTLVLLENIRRYKGEELNDKVFAKRLATFGHAYINDAFSVSHRKHASVVALPKLLPSYAGVQIEEEIKQLSRALVPKHPFVFLLGGAKFATKIPLLKKFIDAADSVIITGAIMNNFYRAAGFSIGDSVVEDGYDTAIKKLLKHPKLLLPIDCLVVRGDTKVVVTPEEVQKGDVIVDIGPRSVALITEKIQKAKLVIWNGPTGWYEKGFTKATTQIAQAIAAASAQSIVGGGDTGAVVEKTLSTASNKKVFVSTGGGAALDFLSQGTLPGITALG
jgi:phosphoglycerate kinase